LRGWISKYLAERHFFWVWVPKPTKNYRKKICSSPLQKHKRHPWAIIIMYIGKKETKHTTLQ
jgi:hypothetical protein